MYRSKSAAAPEVYLEELRKLNLQDKYLKFMNIEDRLSEELMSTLNYDQKDLCEFISFYLSEIHDLEELCMFNKGLEIGKILDIESICNE